MFNNGSTAGILNLQKNDILDLTKKNPGLNHVVLAAGWDVAKKGFFRLGNDCDLDLVAILLDKNNKLINSRSNFIFFNCKSGSGIRLHGDNLTGEGDGDDEKISVTLSKLPSECERVVFAAAIYDAVKRKQSFSQVRNAYVRLLDEDKREAEICRYNLSEDGGKNTALLFAELKRDNGDWQFKAVGELIQASVGQLKEIYK